MEEDSVAMDDKVYSHTFFSLPLIQELNITDYGSHFIASEYDTVCSHFFPFPSQITCFKIVFIIFLKPLP